MSYLTATLLLYLLEIYEDDLNYQGNHITYEWATLYFDGIRDPVSGWFANKGAANSWFNSVLKLTNDGTGYLLDIGTEIAAKSGFYLPNDIPDTEKSTILTNIGAQPLSAITDIASCSNIIGTKLRKLKFTRANGNTISVPVSSRANLLNAAPGLLRGLQRGTVTQSTFRQAKGWANQS